MPIYLSSNPKFDANVLKLLSKLQKHLKLITGDEIAQIKTVAFAILYTMEKLPEDKHGVDKINQILESNKFEDDDFIDQKIQEFDSKIRPIENKILIESLEG